MTEALSSISKSYRFPISVYDVLSHIWVTLYGGMAGYTEYCRIRNIPVFDLNWTDKKAEAKNTRLF